MTTLAKLLAEKQELVARLQQDDIGPEERNEIERLLEKIEAALDMLDKGLTEGHKRAPHGGTCNRAIAKKVIRAAD